jgi:hypothetical protein
MGGLNGDEFLVAPAIERALHLPDREDESDLRAHANDCDGPISRSARERARVEIVGHTLKASDAARSE